MDEIIKTLQKMADIAEQKGLKIFYKTLSKQYSDVARYIIKYGIDATIRDIDRIIRRDDMLVAMIKYYEVAAIPMASYQYKLLKNGEKAFGPDLRSALKTWLQQIQEYIYTRVGSLITNIDETTRTNIRTVLAEAKDKGLGARAAAKLVADQNDPMVHNINKKRALLIARTEGTRSASQGAKMASDQWKKETGQPRYKKWVSIIDKRTRPDHVEADGQFVPDDQMFNVNGTLMEYPGDENAPANETCNCRCRVIYMSKRMAMRLQQSLAA